MGVSERRKCKWPVRVGASNGVTPLIKKIMVGGGGVSGQPENPPGYATVCSVYPTCVYCYAKADLPVGGAFVVLVFRCVQHIECEADHVFSVLFVCVIVTRQTCKSPTFCTRYTVASRRTRGPVDKISLGPLSSLSQTSSVVFRILRVFRIV